MQAFVVLDHNSFLFLSQALWPLQTYRAYLSIGHCRPQLHMCLLVCVMIFHPNSAALSAAPEQVFDLEETHEQLPSAWSYQCEQTSPQAGGPVFIPVLTAQLISCLTENVIAYAASVFGSRQEILSQSAENREGVSRLCFPRSHATRHTHTCAHARIHKHPEGAEDLVPIHYSPSQVLILLNVAF